MRAVRIAVEGCGHGTLHAIYASIEESCRRKGWPGIDLLIICGDFQAVRNAYDLRCVAMPAKYRQMADFHEYYSGARKAPYLTIFIGGNHEASNYLFELYYGGWVAENIYYMGAANVLRFGPLRIAGLSGIWKGYDYRQLHHERLPYSESDLKTIYHVREIDARKLLQVTGHIDIGLSHDWPRGVEWLGDFDSLFRRKLHLRADAERNELGSVAAKLVLDHLKPDIWCSAHLHCKYTAIIDHNTTQPNITTTTTSSAQQNGAGVPQLSTSLPDEIMLDLDDESDEPSAAPQSKQSPPNTIDQLDIVPEANGKVPKLSQQTIMPDEQAAPEGNLPSTTRFLALDKCLHDRDFLQLLEIPSQTGKEVEEPFRLQYDQEWLAITRAIALSEPLILGDPKFNAPRAKSKEEYAVLIEEQVEWLKAQNVIEMDVPYNFEKTAPDYDGGNIRDRKYDQDQRGLEEYSNPQTMQFCDMLQIPNPFNISADGRSTRMTTGLVKIASQPTFHHDNRGGSHREGRGGFRGRGGRGYRGSRGGHRGREHRDRG